MENLTPADPLGLPQIATLASGARVRITRADASDIVFDMLGAVPAITDPLTPEIVAAPCRGVTGGTFADFAEVVAHLEGELAKPAPTPPCPDSVPLWAFRRVLDVDDLLDLALAAVATAPEPTRTTLITFLEYGNSIDRKSPALAQIAAALYKNAEEVDRVFRRADALRL